MTTRNGYESLIYAQVGKAVVDTVADVVDIFRSIVKNNSSTVQSIAFSSITFDSSSNKEFFSSPFFKDASFDRLAEYAMPIISDIVTNTSRHRSVPTIEEIEDLPPVQSQTFQKLKEVEVQSQKLKEAEVQSQKTPQKLKEAEVQRRKTPQKPKSMPKILNVPDINAMKDVISRTSKSQSRSKSQLTKDIVVEDVKDAKNERARPTGRLYDDVPEGVHIDEKFAKDLATLSGGTSMMKSVMPALGVCVSKLKKINF